MFLHCNYTDVIRQSLSPDARSGECTSATPECGGCPLDCPFTSMARGFAPDSWIHAPSKKDRLERGARCDEGPGALALDDEREVEEELLSEVGSEDLQADG